MVTGKCLNLALESATADTLEDGLKIGMIKMHFRNYQVEGHLAGRDELKSEAFCNRARPNRDIGAPLSQGARTLPMTRQFVGIAEHVGWLQFGPREF